MMRIATGLDDFALHEIGAEQAAGMLQQFVQQVHEFPAPPLNYRPQDNEPPLSSDAQVRLIVGFSGAGKTSWAAHAALADARPHAYFDVADLPSSSVSHALAREIAARWLQDDPKARQAVSRAALSGAEALRLVSASLATERSGHTVVIDNAHRLQTDDARAIAAARGALRLVFLAQPTAELDQLGAALDVEPQTLQGWGSDAIGYEASDQGCPASVETTVRIRRLTAGLPLYVRSAIDVAIQEYASNLEAFCDAFEGQDLSSDTLQHTLLTVVFNGLDVASKQVLACASIPDLPLSAEEIAGVVAAAFPLDRSAVLRKLRSLRARGLLQAYGSQRSKVHDAMRPIALEHLIDDPKAGRCAKTFLLELVETSVRDHQDAERFPLWVKLLIDLRAVERLADLGSEEAFHERPGYPQMWPLLEEAARDDSLDPDVRFECLDALLYQRQRHGPEDTVAPLLAKMEALVSGGLKGERPRLVFLQKSVIYWAEQNNQPRVFDLLAKASLLLPDKTSHRRVFTYTAALALWKISKPAAAEQQLKSLIAEYVATLSINVEALVKNPEVYADRVRSDDRYGTDCKRLADCFDLLARVLEDLRRPIATTRVFALRLFNMTGSWDSVVRVGIDLAYQHLDAGQFAPALKLVSATLPDVVRTHELSRHTAPLRYLHAHVLGQMGQIPAAREVLKTADPYFKTLASDWKLEARRLTDFLR
jgi:hypothetical protein